MKKIVLILLFSFLVFQLSAQKPIIYDSLVRITTNGDVIQKQIWFDMNDSTDREYFIIDTTQANNIWQYAKVNKPGFAQLNSIALTTDSIADYPINDTSSFIFKIQFVSFPSQMYSQLNSLGITLHHKFETDSAKDGLQLEFYNAFSHKWELASQISSSVFWLMKNSDSTYNWDDDLLTGTALQFHNSRLAYGELGVKASIDSLLLRFTFYSDSIDNHKAGWLIDSIMIEANSFRIGGGFNECKLAQNDYLAYYDGNSIIINSLLAENRKSDFSLFDMMGKELLIDEIHFGLNSISVDNLPTGYYIVKVKNQAGVFTKKILIE
jgi:hypothetical protein